MHAVQIDRFDLVDTGKHHCSQLKTKSIAKTIVDTVCTSLYVYKYCIGGCFSSSSIIEMRLWKLICFTEQPW